MILPLLFSLILTTDPCVRVMEQIKASGRFKEASFHLEWSSGELDQTEIDYLAAYILVTRKLQPTDKEKLDFLNMWNSLRKHG